MNTSVALGIELGDGLARAVLVGAGGEVLAGAERAHSEPLDAAARAAEAALSTSGGAHPIAVGISASEAVTRTPAALPETLSRIAGETLVEPVLSCGSAAALAEAWCGAARGSGDLIVFSVGSRVSAGVISGGRLLAGAHGLGSSVSWLALNPVEREDYRRLGCLEAEAGAAGIVRRLIWRIKAGDRSRVLDMAGGDLASITVDQIVKGARDGDGVAISVMRDTVKYLGMAVSNIAAVVDPDVIVLGGLALSAGDLLLEPIRLECGRRMPPAMFAQVRIVLSTLGADAAAIGAARHAFNSLSPTPAAGASHG
jgi:glucokinase